MAKSDGGSSSYYKMIIPAGTLKIAGGSHNGEPLEIDLLMETDDVINLFLANDWHKGNIFKALVRMGSKDGIESGYDFNKIRWFLDRMENRIIKGSAGSIEDLELPDLAEIYQHAEDQDPTNIMSIMMRDIRAGN